MLHAKPVQTLACLAVLLVGAGCRTYNEQNKGGSLWKAGNAEAAAAEFTGTAESNKNNKDTVIWRLEQGYVLHATAKFEDSLKGTSKNHSI